MIDNETTTKRSEISFFYGNIYYKNTNTEGLLSTITQKNPDIIMLVEYSKYHDEHLTESFKITHPYVSRYSGNK